MGAAIEQISPTDHPSLRAIAQSGRCPTIEQLNEQIRGLRFVELLGRGGSGWTFLAVQESLSRQVAVKVLHRPHADADDSASRFRREAESLARLNHSHIVTVHDFGVADEFLYLVMEYVPGPTLRQRMQSLAPTVPQSLQIVKQICAAVQCAHDAGVLHRDVKPENILFDSHDANAQIKVADFGIAQMLSIEPVDCLTATGIVIGTPFYMAPEQADHRASVDHRADVYSIGVIAYELLTGRLPMGRFPSPSSFAPCSKSVDRAVLRALQYRLTDRTPDAKTLAGDLNPAVGPTRTTRAIVVLLLVVAATMAAWWIRHDGDAPTLANDAAIASGAQIASTDKENPFLIALAQQRATRTMETEPSTGADPQENESSAESAPSTSTADADASAAWVPAVGNRVKAKWGATWYDATVLRKVGEDLYHVHYEGWSEQHDETLPQSRIRQHNWLD